MKKITSLQVAFLMSLALGSSFMTECYGKSDKYAEKSAKAKPVKSGKKDTIKCIEADLHKIKRAFQKNHNKEEALEHLRALEPRIKALIASLKKSEVHGKMWETHEHTLNRKLREVREYVKNHEKKEVAIQSRSQSDADAA